MKEATFMYEILRRIIFKPYAAGFSVVLANDGNYENCCW